MHDTKETRPNRVYIEPGKPGKLTILTKSQGNPRTVKGISVILIQVREKPGKTNCLVYISFSLTVQSGCSI